MDQFLARIALLGSGELAPSMVKVHRQLFKALPENPRPVLIDSTFGFQENADELVNKAQTYFDDSFGLSLAIASLRRAGSATASDKARFFAAIEDANYIFAGPGSPSYALRTFHDIQLSSRLSAQLFSPVVISFASAAAATVGAYAVPVYEIYKAGEDPTWLTGLDLLGGFGLTVAVVPHYDNQEGTTHDTRFCYIGERRLRELEDQLPSGVPILGIDEHTALVLDTESQYLEVLGKSAATIRREGKELRLPTGTRLPLREAGLVLSQQVTPKARICESSTKTDEAIRFHQALVNHKGSEVIEILITAIDSEQYEQTKRLLIDLEQALTHGFVDHEELLRPTIALLIEIRTQARSARDFIASDFIRGRLGDAGIVIEDTPEGTTWHLLPSE
ncbi:MAG: hypothetical protein ACYDHP_14170 [Ferrimicrobium sp.]